jgi:hypothetical protein
MVIPFAREVEIADQLEVVARVAQGDRLSIRGVVKNPNAQLPDATNAVDTITLEEAYLAFMVNLGVDVGGGTVRSAQ